MTPGRLKIWNEDAGEWQYTSGGSQPGASRVIDLGLVNAADLIDGAQTLYTPTEGEFVMLMPGGLADFVQIDNVAVSIIMGQYPPLDYGVNVELNWDQVVTDPAFLGVAPVSSGAGSFPFTDGQQAKSWVAIRDTRPILAAIAVQSGDDPVIIAALSAWQALHPYANNALVSGAGHIWIGDGGGDSGASEPDWASNFGSSVMDGDTTWFDQGAFPVAGTLHMFALVATPAAP